MKALRRISTGELINTNGFIKTLPDSAVIDDYQMCYPEIVGLDLELVEVIVLEKKPVTEEIIKQQMPTVSNYWKPVWMDGFKSALDYLGIKMEDK